MTQGSGRLKLSSPVLATLAAALLFGASTPLSAIVSPITSKGNSNTASAIKTLPRKANTSSLPS